MKYEAHALGKDLTITIDKEGIYLGKDYIDYSVIRAFRPINYRILIELLPGYTPEVKTIPDEQIEISMLGRSFDGFWEELITAYGDRSLAALFVKEAPIMRCEGDYQTCLEAGRGTILLYPDAICIAPQTVHAVRIPLCFTASIEIDGYQIRIKMQSGKCFMIGRMGYETKVFAERAITLTNKVKKDRLGRLKALSPEALFPCPGLFRTYQEEASFGAAFGTVSGRGRCALELYTDDDSATYLYEFQESKEDFCRMLEEALETVGTNREVIYLTEDQLLKKPLYMMAIQRCDALRFLRSKAAGRVIHSQSHKEKVMGWISNCSF